MRMTRLLDLPPEAYVRDVSALGSVHNLTLCGMGRVTDVNAQIDHKLTVFFIFFLLSPPPHPPESHTLPSH